MAKFYQTKSPWIIFLRTKSSLSIISPGKISYFGAITPFCPIFGLFMGPFEPLLEQCMDNLGYISKPVVRLLGAIFGSLGPIWDNFRASLYH